MTDTEFHEGVLQSLASMNASLASIAQYFERQAMEEGDETTYEVGSFVLSRSSKGDPCAYLYATHPGLKHPVAKVYVEKFGVLPFDPNAAKKTFVGEQGPTRQFAMSEGFMQDCPVFTAVNTPTGKLTEAGLKVRKFDRVLSVDGSTLPASPPSAQAQKEPPADPLPAQPEQPKEIPFVLSVQAAAAWSAKEFPALFDTLDAAEGRFRQYLKDSGKKGDEAARGWMNLCADLDADRSRF